MLQTVQRGRQNSSTRVSFISINWRGRPLRTFETTINLIGNTTNCSALVVRALLDLRRYRQEGIEERP
jgi:hypothetical protein